MINTFNESSLHKKLKTQAAQKYGGKTEQEIGNYICDVLTEDGTIIEIQTKSFKNICAKLTDLLQTHRLILIYPLICETYIEYYDEGGTLLSRRKSPKKRGIFSIFDELTGIWPILLHKNFTLEVIESTAVKKRKKTAEPVQSVNKKRRFKKNWLSFDTELLCEAGSRFFCSKKDYLELLAGIPEEFGVKEAAERTGAPLSQTRKMLWTLRKTGLIEKTGCKGRRFIYRIKERI
ncbi:helix-turn-helix domain-containing protein [Treponema sp. HNW]|uniref:helix-turn-helix domain-containing protein n=1 Tax=Treponema sp. HNW TaxID=3116654 RepID=UPI003D1123D6